MPTHRRLPIAVVGAGPYGLATAAHLAARGRDLRVFGEPMAGWRDHMPAGMFLKSTPRASNISAPAPGHRLADHRTALGVAPVGDRYPVPIAEFIAYGDWFQQRCVPGVERCSVLGIGYDHGVLRLRLDTGEEFRSRAVVLATGLRAFAHVPGELAALREAGLASHTSDHADLGRFAGRRVAVVGAGQSALESAALLAEAGARPTLVARTARLRFGTAPGADLPGERPAAVRARYPGTELGPGWNLLGYCRAPWAFRHLPDDVRAWPGCGRYSARPVPGGCANGSRTRACRCSPGVRWSPRGSGRAPSGCGCAASPAPWRSTTCWRPPATGWTSNA